MAKYAPLADYLADRPNSLQEITLSFAEVEDLVGTLPASARTYRPWWANDSKSEAVAWRSAGWHVAAVNMTAERVTFRRGTVGGTYGARRSARSASASDPAVASPRQAPPAAHPTSGGSETETTTEAQIQARVVTHLASQGWSILRVADTGSREQGIDILARRGEVTLAVEVKGQPGRQYADPHRAHETKPTQPATQSRHWYAQALLKCLLTKDEHPQYQIAIALPDAVTYRNLHARTQKSLEALGIRVLIVTTDAVMEF